MSYDIYLSHPSSDGDGPLHDCDDAGRYETLHQNITYNYWPHFRRVLGSEGIRSIYGLTGAESILVLDRAINELGNDVDDDYWASTEGNAKMALLGLRRLAAKAPEGVWQGD